MRRKVLLAGLFHETHTFLAGCTRLEDFSIRRDAELIACRDDASPLAGFWEVADQKGWQVIPLLDMRALPGPTVADEVVDYFWKEFSSRAVPEIRRGVEGIYLVLHGAMVSESVRDVEGRILEKIRTLEGAEGLPVCGVVDLHANFSRRMARYSQGLIAYRENPHTDASRAAADAARLLDFILTEGWKPRTVYAHPPIMWPPTGTSTAEEPMCRLEALARDLEKKHENVLAVNVFAGFAFADTEDTGVSFTAVTRGCPEEAQKLLKRLSALAVAEREGGNRLNPELEKIIPRLRKEKTGPIILVEPSDNIGGGAPGDCTGALRALLAGGFVNCVCVINDPAAVKSLSRCRVSEKMTLNIGGRGFSLDQGPLCLDLELVSRSDGCFELEDENSHLASMIGSSINMGPCAVVRTRGVTILLTSIKTPPFDLGQLRSQGIIPEEQFIILVKAAVAHRRAYDPIARISFTVDTPGPCSSDLRRFPYRYVRRPLFPLDVEGDRLDRVGEEHETA
jgi:microcystin degradation protein MlrC